MNAKPEETHFQPAGKINYGAQGLGTVSPETVERRANELARIDGRSHADDADRITAMHELAGPEDPEAPETGDPVTRNLTAWDDNPQASGTRVPRVVPEDEASVGQTLIEEGLEEADHDQRLTAAKENPEEPI